MVKCMRAKRNQKQKVAIQAASFGGAFCGVEARRSGEKHAPPLSWVAFGYSFMGCKTCWFKRVFPHSLLRTSKKKKRNARPLFMGCVVAFCVVSPKQKVF